MKKNVLSANPILAVPAAYPADANLAHPLSTIVPSPQTIPLPTSPRAELARGALIYKTYRMMRSFEGDWLWLMLSWVVCIPIAFLSLTNRAPDGLLVLLFPGILWLRLALKSWSTRYEIYQSRIDFVSGIFSKKIEQLWLFQIKDVKYQRSLLDSLIGSSEVQILAEKATLESVNSVLTFQIIGLPSPRADWGRNQFMEELYQALSEAALLRRKEMKDFLV